MLEALTPAVWPPVTVIALYIGYCPAIHLHDDLMSYPVYLPEISPNARPMPPRIPQAAHRHAAPSGPWPWADLVEDSGPFVLKPLEETVPGSENPEKDLWRRYPSNLFPNWNSARVWKSGIGQLIHTDPSKDSGCVIYHNDMTLEGQFLQPRESNVRKGNEDEFWNMMKVRPMLKELAVELISPIIGTKEESEG